MLSGRPFNSELLFQATFKCHKHSSLTSKACKDLQQIWALPQLLFVAFFFQFFYFSTQPVRLLLELCHLLCSTGVTYRTPCYASGQHMLSKPLPSKSEDIPSGSKCIKNILLPTNNSAVNYLTKLQIFYAIDTFLWIYMLIIHKSKQNFLMENIHQQHSNEKRSAMTNCKVQSKSKQKLH